MRRLWMGTLLISLLLLSACGTEPGTATPPPAPTPAPAAGDLGAVKTYLLENVDKLKNNTAALKATSDQYYELAQGAGGDYAALWQAQQPALIPLIQQAQSQWKEASPSYERIEGLVAGVPSLAEYDLILDAGAAGSEGGENVVPFDLTLPDGRTLPKPGNLFGVTESALWGSFAAYRAPGVTPDFDNNGTLDFGEALPDAAVLKGSVDALDRYTGELVTAAGGWQPTESDAFTTLVVMVPTMSEYFDSWKTSRFVAGAASDQRDFVAISRLADIQDILGGLQIVYANISPRVRTVDAAQDEQITQRLADLKAFIADVYRQEQSGKRYTAEEADLLGVEAQNRATAITGQITQVAAQLNVTIQQ